LRQNGGFTCAVGVAAATVVEGVGGAAADAAAPP